jgi:hypothetical protein
MENVPNIVRERLRAVRVDANHPDADVLTAFAERSLAEGERTGVMEHLALCSDCRDVLALALPATEATEVAPTLLTSRSSAKGWLTWPVLRWGLAVAGIIAVGSFGILKYQQRTQENLSRQVLAQNTSQSTSQSASQTQTVAKESASQDKNTKAYLEMPVPAGTAVSASRRAQGSANASSSNTQGSQTAERISTPSIPETPGAESQMFARGLSPASSAMHGQALDGPVASSAFGAKEPAQSQQQNAARTQTVTAATPSAAAADGKTANTTAANVPQTTTVEVSSASQLINTETVNTETENVPTQKLPLSQANGQLVAQNNMAYVSKAKPAMTPQPPAPLNGRNVGQLVALVSSTRWNISPTGGLQRSLDQGNTWQDVDVIANPAVSLEVSNAAATAAAKKEQAALVFRAVVANGAEVWAGGSAGALFHSVDSGGHWARVVASSASAVLSGDIVRVEFSDVLHGKITTSTPEVWTTSDDGQSWQKQ